jgi:hypothetical protein
MRDPGPVEQEVIAEMLQHEEDGATIYKLTAWARRTGYWLSTWTELKYSNGAQATPDNIGLEDQTRCGAGHVAMTPRMTPSNTGALPKGQGILRDLAL